MDKLLTTKAAAAILGISPRTLQSWRAQGKSPKYQRLGHKTIRYKEEDLKQWVKENSNYGQ